MGVSIAAKKVKDIEEIRVQERMGFFLATLRGGETGKSFQSLVPQDRPARIPPIPIFG